MEFSLLLRGVKKLPGFSAVINRDSGKQGGFLLPLTGWNLVYNEEIMFLQGNTVVKQRALAG